MPDLFTVQRPVNERPLSDWATITVELLGATTEIVEGARWCHRVIHKGDGPPLLMYHGIGGHAEAYARTLPQIADAGYHAYAVDALFHGFTSKDADASSDAAGVYAEGVVDLIEALGYKKVHYAGESMGAVIGVDFAMSFPEYTDKVILNGFGSVQIQASFPPSPGFGMKILGPLSFAALDEPTYENIAMRLHWLVHPDHPERITDEMIRLRQRMYATPEINKSLRRVFGTVFGAAGGDPAGVPKYTEDDLRERWKAETLVLWGAYNPGHGPDFGAYAADLIGAKFYEFKDAGHWPQWEMPDEYSQVIVEFLNS